MEECGWEKRWRGRGKKRESNVDQINTSHHHRKRGKDGSRDSQCAHAGVQRAELLHVRIARRDRKQPLPQKPDVPCSEPGGSACRYWKHYGKQRHHPAQGPTARQQLQELVPPGVCLAHVAQLEEVVHARQAVRGFGRLAAALVMLALQLQ